MAMTNDKQKNARFWISFAGSFVKLTMKPGDEMDMRSGGRDEEGYSVHYQSYEYDGEVVRLIDSTDSRDCDGHFSTEEELECPVEQLKAREPYRPGSAPPDAPIDPEYCPEPGARFPQWERVRGRQRDYSAEAMNY